MGFLAPIVGSIAGSIFSKIGGGGGGGSQPMDEKLPSTGGGGGLLPFLTQMGGAVGSSLLGKALTPGMTDQQKQATSLLQQGQQQAFDSSRNLMGQGQQALQQPLNYWSSLLSGNKGLATSALGPEISQIGQGYNTAARTSAALNPRGGPSAEFNAELPFRQQHDVTSLFQQMRPQAAQQLGGMGQNLLSSGANLLLGSTSAGRDILSSQQAFRDLQSKQGSDIGGGLFSIFKQYGQPAMEGILGRLGKGGGGVQTSTDTTSGKVYPY